MAGVGVLNENFGGVAKLIAGLSVDEVVDGEVNVDVPNPVVEMEKANGDELVVGGAELVVGILKLKLDDGAIGFVVAVGRLNWNGAGLAAVVVDVDVDADVVTIGGATDTGAANIGADVVTTGGATNAGADVVTTGGATNTGAGVELN